MEQLYEIKTYERRQPEIYKLSLGYFVGDEIYDFKTAREMKPKDWKTLCAKNNIRYITKA